jgi:iron-sulfur cluster repair protein YtfE (RIC family)
MRKEYGSMPLLVKSIADGDSERAALVTNHLALMHELMHAHHKGEDVVLWPLVRDRNPEHEAIFVMDDEHDSLNRTLSGIKVLAQTWRDDPSANNRAALHTELIAFEKTLLRHLGHEEREVLPILQRTVSQSEYDALGVWVRENVPQDDAMLLLGLILEDTTATNAEAVLATLPADVVAEAEANRPTIHAYRRRLMGM